MGVVIRKTADGPYVVQGEVTLLDADGLAYQVNESFALCRCGKSKRPPFCDASHSATAFRERSTADLNTE